MKNFDTRLEKAWNHRHQRELEDCANEVRELAKINPDNPELRLLQASLLRVEAKLQESKALIDEIKHQNGDLGGRLTLQEALNYFAVGDYAHAWPLFQQAKNKLKNENERLMAATNLIGCRDNLGLDFSNELEELENMPKSKKLKFADLFSQIRLLRLRLCFRNGEFDQIFFTTKNTPSQEQYFQFWVAALPYTKTSFNSPDLSKIPSHFFQFRVHTLLGKTEKDSEKVKSSELIDRIYLWTWQWLNGSTVFSYEKIISQLKKLSENPTACTCEDFLLLRNSLGWLDLFTSSDLSSTYLPKYAHYVSTHFPLLEYEWQWIEYFSKKRDGGIAHKPSPKFPSLLLSELETNKLIFGQFQLRLRTLMDTSKEQLNTIYPSRSLAISKIGQKLHSSDSVRLAAMTLKFSSLSFEQIANELWGIRSFNPESHTRKIHRVIFSMKNFFPVKCKTRDKNLFTEWKDPPKLIDNPDLNILPYVSSKLRSIKRKNILKPIKSLSIPKNKILRREEVEQELGCSRATAARWIKKNLKEGHLRKIGNGKNIHYEWSIS